MLTKFHTIYLYSCIVVLNNIVFRKQWHWSEDNTYLLHFHWSVLSTAFLAWSSKVFSKYSMNWSSREVWKFTYYLYINFLPTYLSTYMTTYLFPPTYWTFNLPTHGTLDKALLNLSVSGVGFSFLSIFRHWR